MSITARPSRGLRSRPLVTVVSVVLAFAVVAPVAMAADPSPSTTAAPPTTIPAPTVPPSTVTGASTTTLAAGPTTTTVPGATTTVAPTTTVVDPDADSDEGNGGFATTPAPLIPSAASDPLFHAALTVDDDLRTQSLANIAYLKAIAASRHAQARARRTGADYARVHAADRAAAKRLGNAKSILRAAALHAYAGYGSMETAMSTPQTQGSETVLPYRTYVRVTIADATRHVSEATRDFATVHRRAVEIGARNDSARKASERAVAARRRGAKAVDAARKKLAEDRKALNELIASMPDLGQGTDARLPEVTRLPPGATAVESPAGTIVVPRQADPRTAVALQFIVAQMGKPYLWGGTGPNAYDCSGLMLRAFQAAGVTTMPRVSQGQQVWATPVDAKDARPGDLVFFGTPAYHVGVYIGDGLMIDAPYTGSHVRVDKVWSSVSGYGRVVW